MKPKIRAVKPKKRRQLPCLARTLCMDIKGMDGNPYVATCWLLEEHQPSYIHEDVMLRWNERERKTVKEY